MGSSTQAGSGRGALSELDAAATTLGPGERRADFTRLATEGALAEENVELRFVPVHDLERRRVTTFFCAPAFCIDGAPVIYGYGALQGIGARDLPYIDRAILGHTVKFARRLAQAGTAAVIGTSVNYATLAWPKGWEVYEQALRAAAASECPFLLLKIDEIPSGVSTVELAGVVARIRPYLRRIFLRLPDCEASIQRCGNLGISGLVLSLPPRATRIITMATAKWLLREAEAQTAQACIDHVDTADALDLIRAAGVRFAAGRHLGTSDFRGNALAPAVEYYMAETARRARRAERCAQGS